METKSHTLPAVRVTAALDKAARKAAAKDGRTVADWVRRLVESATRKNKAWSAYSDLPPGNGMAEPQRAKAQ